jgi:eukaryotic-like serine/threonine-protein kinase
MGISAGTKLGPYEIVAPLGAGGMGEVYRARDSRLGREVAIKVLPSALAKDGDRLQRFEQEARVLSALNHPNLLSIYDVGNEDGLQYLVSEYLEGQTLRERLQDGALPQRKVIEYSTKIANGLAAAHDKGIVHRDLKPENIFITKDEHVKILDFGLAKYAMDAAQAGSTLTIDAGTAPGTVMGSVGYMSPEQVRGEPADSRSDIFGFGAILYEMMTGKRAFSADTPVETMNAILKSEPPEIDLEQNRISPGLERIARHCLEKNPSDRFQSARDLSFALTALSGTGATAALRAVEEPKRPYWWWAVGGLAALLVLQALYFTLRTPKKEHEAQQEFAIPLQGEVNHLAISADGTMLVYSTPDDLSGKNVLKVERVGSRTAVKLDGTEGASYPFWSPDNLFVGFFADGKLKKVPVTGGTPQALALTPNGRGATWGTKNVIVYAPDAATPLWGVNADGTNAAQLTKTTGMDADFSHRFPAFLPDGDHFLYWVGNFRNLEDDQDSGIYLSSLSRRVEKRLLLVHSNPGYADGRLFYVNAEKSLVAVALDVEDAKLNGTPKVIGEGVGFQPSTYWAAFTVSDNATVVYNTGMGATLSQLTWYGRDGKEQGTLGEVGEMANPALSPDDRFVALDRTDIKAANVDIWIEDVKKGTASRFTFSPAEEVDPVWSRDGKQIAYRSIVKHATVVAKDVRGLEPERVVTESATDSPQERIPNGWSVDDTTILCTGQLNGAGAALWTVPSAGGQWAPFVNGKASYTSGQISPDGKWVAYASNETGDWEIYVTTFPTAAGKWQVSRGGGTEPRWRGDGNEVFYLGMRGMLTAVEVSRGERFSSGMPRILFPFAGRAQISSTDLFSYDVTKDGQRFVVNRYKKPETIAPLTVVLRAGE